MADTPKSNKERLAEITAGIEQGIQDLFQSDRYAQYLSTMSRFHRYSLNNTMLIYMQKPDATLVAGFGKWRDQFERNVKKGEKGIQIIAPTPFKKKIEMEKLDPDTQAPVLNADGTVATEEKEIQIPMYKPVFVFDVGQTEGKPLPTLAADLTSNVARYDFFMEALRRASPVPMEFEVMRESTDGYFSLDSQRIAIREGMSEAQTVSAAVHEITHAKLHNYEQERLAAPVKEGAEPPRPKDRRTEEVEADSVSYSVCQFYGIETGENSFGYIASWSSDKSLPELRASLETINKTASGLIGDIDYHFRAVVKEYDAVLEVWAADYDTYVRDNSVFVISSREEVIADAVADIKTGYGVYAHNNLVTFHANGAPAPDELLRRLDEIEKNYPRREMQAAYLLDNETYLHIHESDTGYDYTLYDKSLREIDGGLVEAKDFSLDDAYAAALEIQQIYPETVEKVSLDLLDEIDSVHQRDVEQYKREHNIDQPEAAAEVEQWETDHITDSTVSEQPAQPPHPMPEAPEQVYSYPMPDPDLSVEDLENCGYMDGDMLPLSQYRALELYANDLTIYMIDDEGEARMAFDSEEIMEHGGIFAVPYEEWEQARGELAPAESRDLSEQSFLDAPNDTFAIYQLKHGELYRDYRFESLERLQSAGLSVDHSNYNLVYSAPLAATGNTARTLESIYEQFNVNHPADFRGHSLSVSDIIALKQNGNVTYHYCDSMGFAELPGFYSGKNPLRAVEDAIEQNDNNLDGIINNMPAPTVTELEAQVRAGQSISLMDLARATHAEEKEKRPSVLENLRRKQQETERSENKNKAPRKSAEMGL